jgi:acyl dehydratase
MLSDWPPFKLSDKFSHGITLSPDSIRTFARLAGDFNPLHHDESFAAQSHFGRLIASGAQTSSLIASWAASLVAERCGSLGLEIMFKFKAAVLADEPLRIEIEVSDIAHKARLDRYVITFNCRMTKVMGEIVAVEGYAKALLTKPVCARVN